MSFVMRVAARAPESKLAATERLSQSIQRRTCLPSRSKAGNSTTYDPRRLTGVSVYQEVDREFSAGDRIQFTAPDKSLGVANRDLAVIETDPSRWPPLCPLGQ